MKVVASLTLVVLISGPAPATEPPDLRSQVLVELECASKVGRRQVTLFGNGTVRARVWEKDQETMRLGELGPDDLEAYLNRLAGEDLSEAESSRYGASGEWVEQCRLKLALEGQPEHDFRFGRVDSLSLSLSRVLGIVEEIGSEAERQAVSGNFPYGYEPRRGDILERQDGLLFEVITFTSDGRGVELRGVDQPLLIYVLKESVVGEFVALVERR